MAIGQPADRRARRRGRRQARWESKAWRVGLAIFGLLFTILLGFVWPSHDASAGSPTAGVTAASASMSVEAIPCSRVPAGAPHHSVKTDPGGPGMPCDQSSPPQMKRCVTGVLGSMLVGGLFGGPLGILSGGAGGLVGCLAGLFT